MHKDYRNLGFDNKGKSQELFLKNMDSTALLSLKGQHHVGYYKKAIRSRKNFSKTRELK